GPHWWWARPAVWSGADSQWWWWSPREQRARARAGAAAGRLRHRSRRPGAGVLVHPEVVVVGHEAAPAVRGEQLEAGDRVAVVDGLDLQPPARRSGLDPHRDGLGHRRVPHQ